MKTNFLLAICLLAAALTSCNSGINQKAEQNTSPLPAGSLVNLPATNAAVPINSPDSGKAASAIAPIKAANSALNPAHGQPGHSCGIAEGAPLSSAVTNTTPPLTNTSPAAIQTQSPTINNSQTPQTVPTSQTTAGINPAHGQPGHKCDIAVGAPLNSKTPSSTAPTVKAASLQTPQQLNNTPSIQSSPLSASLPQSTTSGQNSKVALNPAHGQPGHDCSVPVGKPLKQ